jgi:Domain of unknown function (DUF4760)
MSADDWLAIGTMLLFGATLLGAIFVLIELRNGHREAREANIRAKKQATVTFYTQTLERRINWQSDLPHDRDATAVATLLRGLTEDPHSEQSVDLKNKIHSYLGFWELTAVALRHNVFDEELFQDILKTHFLQVQEHYQPFIEAARTEFGAKGQRLYVEMQNLAADWSTPQPARPRGVRRIFTRDQPESSKSSDPAQLTHAG